MRHQVPKHVTAFIFFEITLPIVVTAKGASVQASAKFVDDAVVTYLASNLSICLPQSCLAEKLGLRTTAEIVKIAADIGYLGRDTMLSTAWTTFDTKSMLGGALLARRTTPMPNRRCSINDSVKAIPHKLPLTSAKPSPASSSSTPKTTSPTT